MRKLRVVYLDVENGKFAEERVIDDDLQEFYKLLNCNTIDIVRRMVGGVKVCIICDDEGYFNPNPKVGAHTLFNVSPPLVGNLIFAGTEDNEGNLTDLTDNEIERIKYCCLKKVGGGFAVLLEY